MSTWKYYNHAMIPNTEPHETVDITQIYDRSIWENKKALFARWTSDYDCGAETNWWYVIKEGPFDIAALDAKARKHIRQAQKQVVVRLIQPEQYANDLMEVHNNACASYQSFSGKHVNPSDFENQLDKEMDFWGAFERSTDRLIGYMSCKRFPEHVETITAKYEPKMQHLRTSDAIHAAILDYYLNQKGYPYVCSGTRNINHVTNVQEYKIKTFGFRKAYCKLHMEFRPCIRPFIPILKLFRPVLKKLGRINGIHLINAVLDMESMTKER